MTTTHRARVEATLADAAVNRAALLERLPPETRATLPVDAQGVIEGSTSWPRAAGYAYAAQERAVVAIAAQLDEMAGG